MKTAVKLAFVLLGASLLQAQDSSSDAVVLKNYFPPGTFVRAGTSRMEWYSREFSALQEAPLWQDIPPGTIIYRFTWLRTFHNPVVIVFTALTDGDTKLRLKVASGAGGYDPGQLITDEEHKLGHDDAKQFLDLIEQKAQFWSQPTEPAPVITYNKDGTQTETIGVDGAQWIMEGVKDGKYHVVDRWSPAHGAYHDAAMFLIRKSGYKVKKDEIY